jgi:hypothetical protein
MQVASTSRETRVSAAPIQDEEMTPGPTVDPMHILEECKAEKVLRDRVKLKLLCIGNFKILKIK